MKKLIFAVLLLVMSVAQAGCRGADATPETDGPPIVVQGEGEIPCNCAREASGELAQADPSSQPSDEPTSQPASQPSAEPTSQPSEALILQPGAAVGDLTTCPVSHEVFTVAEGMPSTEHDGQTIWFCCDDCIGVFNRNPSTFL